MCGTRGGELERIKGRCSGLKVEKSWKDTSYSLVQTLFREVADIILPLWLINFLF